jgi:hypothetical protein
VDPELLAVSGKIISDPDPGSPGSEMNAKLAYKIKISEFLSTKMHNLKKPI